MQTTIDEIVKKFSEANPTTTSYYLEERLRKSISHAVGNANINNWVYHISPWRSSEILILTDFSFIVHKVIDKIKLYTTVYLLRDFNGLKYSEGTETKTPELYISVWFTYSPHDLHFKSLTSSLPEIPDEILDFFQVENFMIKEK